LLFPAHGQCRLSVVSATSLKLSPFNGQNLTINGAVEQVPSAGITISNTGLAASTRYYVYAAMSGGSMALELSATGHEQSATGVEVKTGDASRTLVGMIYTTANTPGQFVDTGANRNLANWFNRRQINAATGTIVDTTTNTAFEELTGGRAVLLSWADEAVVVEVIGSVQSNSAGNNVHTTSVGLDGSTTGAQTVSTTYAANVEFPAIARAVVHPAEGMHFAAAMGKVSTGTGTWNFGVQASTFA